MTCTKRKGFLHKLFHGTGTAIFALFVWEIIEELLENLIAYCISSVMAIFVVKALSTLGIMLATQGIKLSIKRFLFPFIKTLTYKEGSDKMNIVKKYLTMIWGHKFTGLFAGVGFGLVSYYQTALAFATGCWWIALIVGLVFFHIAVFVGGETFKQILARITETTNNKKLKAELKKVQHAQAIVDQYEEAKKIVASAPKQN